MIGNKASGFGSTNETSSAVVHNRTNRDLYRRVAIPRHPVILGKLILRVGFGGIFIVQ